MPIFKKSDKIYLAKCTFMGLGFSLLAYNMGRQQTDAALIAKQATVIEQITTADERTLRSKTDFQRPGVTQEQVDAIVRVAGDYGIDPAFLYAGRRTENGGRGLYYGANFIDADIRERYRMSPLDWQPAMFAKTWNKQLNRLAQRDLAIRSRALTALAGQWNIDPQKWALEISLHLSDAEGSKGLEVTEPPRSKTPSPVKARRGVSPKANGGGHKALKHTRKENRDE